ncbi:MAG: hypothetical protein M3198_00970, partial [Actinomycetota bacterium]|nr:hypothetical protein [Actinomycetota bacterium]
VGVPVLFRSTPRPVIARAQVDVVVSTAPHAPVVSPVDVVDELVAVRSSDQRVGSTKTQEVVSADATEQAIGSGSAAEIVVSNLSGDAVVSVIAAQFIAARRSAR